VGVAQLAPPCDDEQALSPLGGADISGCDDAGLHLETLGMEEGDNDVQPSPLQSRAVLDDDSDGPGLLDDAGELEPEAAALSLEAGAGATCWGVGQVLAGEAPADDGVGGDVGGVKRADIGVPRGKGEATGQDGPTVGVKLHLVGGAVVAGGLQP
jgi:hypothetical protein